MPADVRDLPSDMSYICCFCLNMFELQHGLLQNSKWRQEQIADQTMLILNKTLLPDTNVKVGICTARSDVFQLNCFPLNFDIEQGTVSFVGISKASTVF